MTVNLIPLLIGTRISKGALQNKLMLEILLPSWLIAKPGSEWHLFC